MASPSRVREAARRLALGVALTVGAGVGLGDDLQSEPDGRHGARELRLDLPHLGTSGVRVPRTSPTGVVLLLRGGESAAETSALVDAVPWHVLLVDVDVSRLPMVSTSAPCPDTAAALEDISRRAQREAGLTTYMRPVLVATPGALPLATAAMEGASPVALPAAVAVGRAQTGGQPTCAAHPRRVRAGDGVSGEAGSVSESTRWRYAPAAIALGAPLEAALHAAAREPTRDRTAVQRWLQHFDLPLTAAWSSRPRSMLVLLSPARGWRDTDEALAQQLAAAGVHVVGIDALQSFWQRRSPRDVALELQRLTDALASTGLPVYVGGREFGAETMAVAAEMMASSRRIAGVVLIDPGPTAFFEVEPPALALRPMSGSDWSTRAAVQRLDRPTLCVIHAPTSASTLLCESLARRGEATSARSGPDTSSLAQAIAAFVH